MADTHWVDEAEIMLTWSNGRKVQLGSIKLEATKDGATVTQKFRQILGWELVRKGFGLMFPKRKWKRLEQIEQRKTDFHVGDVVQTKEGFDRGLVTKVDENNMPVEVMASPSLNMQTGKRTEVSYYGGVNSVGWYKTGEHMTIKEWFKIYSLEEGWQRYCEDRRKQAKLDD